MCSSADLGSVTQLSFIKEAFALFFLINSIVYVQTVSWLSSLSRLFGIM